MITPSIVAHSFRVKDETWYFFANSRLWILILSQIYFCVVMQVELLECNFWHGAELYVWRGFSGRTGLGLEFVKIFRSNFGPAYETFYNIKSNDFFFREVDLLCSPR